jgi:hypothetical protein
MNMIIATGRVVSRRQMSADLLFQKRLRQTMK